MTTVSGAPNPRGRASAPRVLCVDDDAAVLRALRRVLSGTYDVAIAVGGLAGLEAIRESSDPFAVVITDLRMPGLSGIGLLQCVRQQSPHTARVLLTGNADVASATDAVNAGEVFRFLTKPCAPDALLEAVGAAHVHHQRLSASSGRTDDGTAAPPAAPDAERVIDAHAPASPVSSRPAHRTEPLQDLVAGLNAMLAAVHPVARACAARIEWRVSSMLRRLQLGIDEHVRAAAALSQLGAVELEREVAERIYGAFPLSASDAAVARRIRARSSELIADVPPLVLVRRVVWGEGHDEQLAHATEGSDEIEIGAVIVEVACMLDDGQRQGRDLGRLLAELRLDHARPDVRVLDALHAELDALAESRVRTLRLRDASPEMMLAGDVFAPNGLLMACRGQRIGDILTHRWSLTWSDAMSEQVVEVVAAAASPGSA